MKSNQSIREPIEFREGPFQTDQRVQQERPDSTVPSGISMKSEQSKREPIEFRSEDFPPKQDLNQCNLTERCCEELASALSSNSSYLKELDLSHSNLLDSGVKLLCFGLGNPHCKLQILRVNRCYITDRCCEALASALSSNSSHLRELDLSHNDLSCSLLDWKIYTVN